ncbi:CPBP family intramembrane glutamic endopeptidase [Neolewinella persica]|uniref:CPBP family intramembrane glutamic endopeptidase n=1 Tax=Neolewinella persica TaxID=70998 RepID=UPI00035F9E85|nr:CPBP family intramembrane glutamic endopeptidase [Neolewinella persica]
MTPISDKSEAPGRLFLSTLVAFFICAMVMTGISIAFKSLGWIDLSTIGETSTSGFQRQQLRSYLLLSNLIPFAGTALLALLLVFKRQWIAASGLSARPLPGSALFATLLFIVALPFVAWLAYLNMQIPLPEWMQSAENNADALLKGILTMESVPEFILAFLAAAVTPAIGEELLMRGVLQRRVFQPWFGNHHAAIWAAAILFSAIHVEFAGFVPRLLLGLLLGYGYAWSGSLWVPILLHLLFNGFQVSVAYFTGEFDPSTEVGTIPPWWAGLISLSLVVWIGWIAEKKFRPEAASTSGGIAGAE